MLEQYYEKLELQTLGEWGGKFENCKLIFVAGFAHIITGAETYTLPAHMLVRVIGTLKQSA